MAVSSLLFLTVLAIVHHPLMVSDKKDPATMERLQQQEKLMALEMKRLRLEFEQKQEERQGPHQDLSQSQEEEGAMLGAAPNQEPDDAGWDGWHYGVLVLFLLFDLCRQSIEHESSYDSSSEEEEEDAAEAAPRGSITQHPGFPDRLALEHFYKQCLQRVSKDLASTCKFVEGLVNELLEACRVLTHQTFLPQLENCIGFASAFEGWGPLGDPPAYNVLVPLLPPKGHFFHLEMGTGEGTLGKHGHILVELECMCKRERLLGDVLCLLHHTDGDLNDSAQGPFNMHLLCTSSHLDVEKTTRWFQSLVGKAWALVAPNYSFQLLAQPSASSCKLKLLYECGRALCIEIILGVQRGDSLVFLASPGAKMDHLNSTVWLETFAIQETLFFQLVSSCAPKDSCHLKCLQILVHLQECRLPTLENRILTIYHFKTCLMHLLVLLPLSEWSPEQIAQRLQDILLYLWRGLEEKCLYHFLLGNSALPIQIPIPTAFRNASPFNLFGHLALDHMAHAQATNEFLEVVEQVKALFPPRANSKTACEAAPLSSPLLCGAL